MGYRMIFRIREEKPTLLILLIGISVSAAHRIHTEVSKLFGRSVLRSAQVYNLPSNAVSVSVLSAFIFFYPFFSHDIL